MLSLQYFIVLAFTIRFLIHMEFILACNVKIESDFTFFYVAIQLSQHNLLKCSLPPLT